MTETPGLAAGGAHASAPTTARGIRLLRLRLAGVVKDYEVDLRTSEGTHRPLSVIAGPTSTGKSSVLRFLAYCMGASDYPDYPEVVRQVRSAVCEAVDTNGRLTLERGISAQNVLVATTVRPTAELHPVEPAGDPNSVSQLLLSTVGLQEVRLREAPTQAASATDPLSFRDLMWLCLFLNDRIGSTHLLQDHDRYKALKLRQVVDAVFGVHDLARADLGQRLAQARTKLEEARRDAARLADFVREQRPEPRDQLERIASEAEVELTAVDETLRKLDRRESAAADFAAEVRTRHVRAASTAERARARVRDRASLVSRFASLRAQYADDVRKLTLLSEAGSVFDQLSVRVCPACLNELAEPPFNTNGHCSMCSHRLPDVLATTGAMGLALAGAGISTDDSDAGDAGTEDSAVARLIKAELRSTKRRWGELDDYWQRLDAELSELRAAAALAEEAESEAAAAVDRATTGRLTPFAAEREDLLRRRGAALVLRDSAVAGLRLWAGVDRRDEAAAANLTQVTTLQRQIGELPERLDRGEVVSAISARYAAILREIRFPKVDQEGELGPFVDDRLVPHARGRSYREASSGGQVLISLAWILAVFECAYEQQAAHPGFLMIDTPQKNLGGQALAGDAEFADVSLVYRFYRHVLNWLEGPGAGAQIIIVDNTPPDVAEPHVVVRYTRDPSTPPFGLIDNEVD